MELLGLRHNDIRHGNFLYVSPLSSNGVSVESLTCPRHEDRSHRYRIIDFDQTEKNDYKLEQLQFVTEEGLFNLLDQMEEGYAMEPFRARG